MIRLEMRSPKNGLGECQVILVAEGNYFENFATKQENLHIEKP